MEESGGSESASTGRGRTIEQFAVDVRLTEQPEEGPTHELLAPWLGTSGLGKPVVAADRQVPRHLGRILDPVETAIRGFHLAVRIAIDARKLVVAVVGARQA